MSSPGPITNTVTYADDTPVIRKASRHSSTSKPSYADEKAPQPTTAPAGQAEEPTEEPSKRSVFYHKYRPFILTAAALVILGWWISATVLEATRHRWIVQTVCAWSLIAIIAFRYIPNWIITKPIESVWVPTVQKPWNALPYRTRLAIGWLCLLGVVFGSAFGFKLEGNTTYGDRAISVFGLFIFQFVFWATSHSRSNIEWSTVIVGLFSQQVIAMFVLKSRAGFDIFNWIATLAADFLNSSVAGATFFFGEGLTSQHLFFTNTLAAIIFFIAFVQMMYYLGVMQWIIGHFAWFFFKIMNVSGAEAVIAAGSPFVGQGESACLVKPYVDLMTPSELHLSMTSGFATIAGSVLTAYINLGVPAVNLVTSSVMSIPASIAISKMRYPELEEPITRGQVVIERGNEKDPAANALHAFSKGAVFGLVVAGMILCNVLTVISLVTVINGLLTWIGRGFGIHHLTLELIFGYIFYPVTFLMGVPRPEILRVSRLLATKFVANEFVAYLDLDAITKSDNPLSHRAYNIASYALCGFANLSSVGIQIGVLGAMAPSRQKVISQIAFSAMIAGFIATMQTAGIAGMLL